MFCWWSLEGDDFNGQHIFLAWKVIKKYRTMQDNKKGKSYCNYYRELSSTIYYLCPFGASIWFSLMVMQLSNPNSSLLAKICPSTVPENRTCSVGWRTIAVIPSIWAWVPLIIPDIKSQNCKRKMFNQVINLLELNTK